MAVIALTGQPNVGKSSVFNALTKLRQHVGNWPGKTVEKKEGVFTLPDGRQVSLIDLPGTYSLTSHTIEEIVTRDFVLENKPDAIINVVDASNLERNLYLTTEILELGRPVVVVLNMMDLAGQKGYRIDLQALAGALGLPVVPVVATRKTGLEELYKLIEQSIDGKNQNRGNFHFSPPVEELIRKITARLQGYYFHNYPYRWLAIKLLEDDPQARELVAATVSAADLTALQEEAGQLPDRATRLAEERYRWINGVLDSAVRRERLGELSPSDRVDLVLTSRWLGVPILLAILAGAFSLIFKLSPPLENLIGNGFAWLSRLLESSLGPVLPGWPVHLLTDGVLAGVGTAMSFVPLIFITFTVFGLLEDVGYFARAAFVMDRLLGPLGLPGKSFISLLMGYGCNVPAIMAARTADNSRDRLLTIMVTPLTICSARQVVAVALIGAFFQPRVAPWVMLGLYLLGFVLISLVSIILKTTVLKTEKNPFFIELPMYRWPNWSNIVTYAWHKTKSYFRRAATYIAVVSALLWILANFPGGSINHSILGVLGQWMQPLGHPFGFDWRLIVALMAGFAAKETTLATLGVLYHANEANIGAVLTASIPFASGLSFFVFSMFYIPCLVTTLTIRNESGSWKWTLFSVVYTLLLAALLSLAAYHLALALA
ncbi:ferrous iron transport protein B [Desulfotomaculum copahuensis]|uniref:Ferrous iron transport protein B n=1 Tax=Desulfotomaculum copahuensis TaxID=1838280 RepID=A0A1B7LH44_9FIRM|nr:ferrous iron transport protein B [Desulfotomaculum copahuensis]OAT85499.1 ferrous iron transport protein B [Desulfotomaculum copahuensis]